MNNRELAKERYAQVLFFLLIWKWLTPHQIARLLGVALPNTYRYIRRLRELGFVRIDRVMGYTLVSLTPEGREFTFDLLPEVEKIRYLFPMYSFKGVPHNFKHEIVLRDHMVNEIWISYSVYAKLLAKVYGKDTIGLHRADAVKIERFYDGYGFYQYWTIAIELELSPKKNAKVKEKLISLAKAIGEYYSRVEFIFKKSAYKERFKSMTLKLPVNWAQTIIQYSNLHGYSDLAPLSIEEDISDELRLLWIYVWWDPDLILIDQSVAKELSRKLR